MELVYFRFFFFSPCHSQCTEEQDERAVMGNKGEPLEASEENETLSEAINQETHMVGQLFKANSKIALEPQVLRYFSRILSRSLRAAGQVLHKNEGIT